ncbi:uracil-DNA glycosylase family protein [Rubellicoccus peritrichatus]|uniref:Uracil-DNA glycosylase family protein n=1 Tax=Rubellicoccus peritrichatus TaxID=3080537 RepID=A0AAQ3LAD9_9BACT|nr:uracil-DNA glycosylase family protein [Puniceicoccus sp. CR14]WOO41622.1 uracil-DNA glycosylase family protein [Puniceicoccus sp. CR14]
MEAHTSLLARVRACRICETHLPDGPRPVLQLHPKARIMVSGQAPGRKVHATGIPFDDASGERLREWMGVSDETFYDEKKVAILPMGFCYPGTGKSGDLPPRPECAPAWREQLLARIPKLELNLVIGKYAHDYHLTSKQKNLTETVRNWQDYWPKVIPLPHPSPRNNIWLKKNPWFKDEVIPALQQRISKLLSE